MTDSIENPSVFQTLRSGKEALSRQVAGQILDLIAAKHLVVGSRLPSNENLSEYLGVSRTSVREAIKLLDAWGAITVKHGVGTFVTGFKADALTLPLMISVEREEEAIVKLHQLREALEPYVAAKAAKNVTSIQIDKMKQSLIIMDGSLDKGEEFIQADLDFHTALAEASGNDFFLMMIHPVIDLLQDARRISIKTRGASSRAQAYHHKIYNLVITGQSDEARDAMKSHLDQTWREIIENLKENGTLS